MFEVLGYLIVAVIAFAAGLLVGRRNPVVANAAASAADIVKKAAADAAAAIKPAPKP